MGESSDIRLLLVDDHPENLLALRAILDGHGYLLRTAGSGPEALALLEREDFALVLLDVAMPGMTGFDVAAAMRKQERTRQVPVIFLTAIATDVEDVYQGYSAGAVDYLLKPLDPKIVRAKVAIFAELFRREREIARQAELIRQSERAHALEAERQARLRAQAAERRYKSLVNALDHAIIWEATSDLRCLTLVSSQVVKLMGYPHARWLDERDFFLSIVHPDDRRAVEDCVRRALEGAALKPRQDMGARCEHRALAADGSERWFHTGIQCDVDGEAISLRGLSVDVSHMKETERSLREAARSREEVVAMVAHDLKNPLTTATLGMTVLKEQIEKGSVADADAQAERILRGLERAYRLIDDILTISRVEAGGFKVETRSVDTRDLLDEAIEMMQPIATQKAIRMSQELDSACSRLRCDRERVLQVLSNVIGNAIKFTPDRGTIRIKTRRWDGLAVISVQDSGMGIGKDDLPHIFRRFWQGAESSHQKGAGLGLAISRGIVEAHGGKIWAESAPEKGTTIFFTLPSVAS